jgi:predicted Zn-dependent protease
MCVIRSRSESISLQNVPASKPNKFKQWGCSVQKTIDKILNTLLPRNPVTQKREFRFLPTAFENALGNAYYDDVCPQYKICENDITDTVHFVFNKLVSKCVRKDELKFEIRVMEDSKIVNAFCLPGGKVVITTALLDMLLDPLKNAPHSKEITQTLFEDRLAAVLGHEIAHACAGHGRRSMQFKLIIG